MHGLVSLLPEPFYSQVEKQWAAAQERYGLKGIYVTPFPHFSWQIAAAYDFPKTESRLATLAAAAAPFRARTAGLGIFSGPQPVVYIAVVKTPELQNFHRTVWETCLPCGEEVSPLYAPDWWMPHISLAYADLDVQTAGPYLTELAFQEFNWEFEVDNLALLYEREGQTASLHYRVPLRGAG